MTANYQAMMAMALAGGGVYPQASWTVWDQWATAAPAVLATATFTLNPDGTAQGTSTPTDGGSVPGTTRWFTTTGGTPGTGYWCRFTVTSGTATSNGASSWSQLNSARSISKAASAGTAGATFTMEIATDAAGANIVFTKTGNQVRYTH